MFFSDELEGVLVDNLDGASPSLDLREHLSTPATPDVLSRQTSNLSDFLGELEVF